MDTYAILLALTALLLTLAAAQDDNCYSYSSDEGHFSYPNACGLLLQAGVSMNITWEGIYQHSNLYFIEVGKEYESTPLTGKWISHQLHGTTIDQLTISA